MAADNVPGPEKPTYNVPPEMPAPPAIKPSLDFGTADIRAMVEAFGDSLTDERLEMLRVSQWAQHEGGGKFMWATLSLSAWAGTWDEISSVQRNQIELAWRLFLMCLWDELADEWGELVGRATKRATECWTDPKTERPQADERRRG